MAGVRKIVVAGGTGFIGRRLTERFLQSGSDVVVLTRSRSGKGPEAGLSFVQWDGSGPGEWTGALEGADAVVNLVGESIGARRWSSGQKRLILRSRLDATAAIGEGIGNATRKPHVLINSSAVGFYGDTGDSEAPETHPRGEGFLSEVVDLWEKEAGKVEAGGTRVVLSRTGFVIGKGAPALGRVLLPFRLFVGGPIGTGRQFFPWVHLEDVLRFIDTAISNPSYSGAYNVTAPGVVRMKEFSRILGRVMKRPSFFPVPSFMLRIAMGEMAELVLSGQRAVPARLQEAGFDFEFPALEKALKQVLG